MVSIAPTSFPLLPGETSSKLYNSPRPSRLNACPTSSSFVFEPSVPVVSPSEVQTPVSSSNVKSSIQDNQQQQQRNLIATTTLSPSSLSHPPQVVSDKDHSTLNRCSVGPKISRNHHHHHHSHNHHHQHQHQLNVLSFYEKQLALIEKADSGLRKHSPVLSVGEGLGGSVYFLKSRNGAKLAVFKPKDEENGHAQTSSAGLKNGTLKGEGVYKEVAAYLFDQRHNNMFNVPTTALVEVYHPTWRKNGQQVKKVGSLQQFVEFEDSAEEIGSSIFPKLDVHRIGLLDCLLFNCDRHSGNLLVAYNEEDQLHLVPIDHSLCLPSSNSLSDALFDWIHFPQSRLPFDEETRKQILAIDIDSDIRYLKSALPELRVQCLETLKITTTFVQKAIQKDLTLHQIGKLMSRFDSNTPSSLECILQDIAHQGHKVSLHNQSFWVEYEKQVDSLLETQ